MGKEHVSGEFGELGKGLSEARGRGGDWVKHGGRGVFIGKLGFTEGWRLGWFDY